MKHHLNTLFVTTQDAYVAKEGQALAVRVERETKLRVPIHNLGGLVCFGRVGCSPAAMQLCVENGASISYLTEHGRFMARVSGFTPGNVLLRRQQYRIADRTDSTLALARLFVVGKVLNARAVLLRGARDRPDAPAAPELTLTANRLSQSAQATASCANIDVLRGIEGEASADYFSAFNGLITTNTADFAFHHRSRRPPLDRINALLSFAYALLAHDARSACEAAGLDPAVGFLHTDRPGRPSLALDLMEEFRPFLADRLVLSMVNRQQIQPSDFLRSDSGAFTLKDAPRKAVLVSYQTRKQEEITHPYLHEKTTVGLLVHLQARLLARHIRGDLDGYIPFQWK